MASQPQLDLSRLSRRRENWTLDQIFEIEIRKQQRLTFDSVEIIDLGEAIKSVGYVKNPLDVAWREEIGFVLIAGERRIRALKMILTENPSWEPVEPTQVIIYENPSDLEIAILQALENSHRRPPVHEEAEHMANAYERAEAFYPGLPQNWFARKMGRGPAALRAARRYTALPDGVKKLVREGSLAYHGAVEFARLLEALGEEEIYQRATTLAADNGSVSDAKRSVRSFLDFQQSGQTSFVDPEDTAECHQQRRRDLIAQKFIAAAHNGLRYFRTVEELEANGHLDGHDLPFTNRAVVETYLKFVRVLEAQLPAFQAAKGELAARRVQHVLTASGEVLEALQGELAIATVGD